LLAATAASALVVCAACVTVFRRPGEWTAVGLIADSVVLGYAGMTLCLKQLIN